MTTPTIREDWELHLYANMRAADGTQPSSDWQAWKENIWDQMARQFHCHPGLAPLEQHMKRSKAEKRCIECGEPGTVQQPSVLIKSVSHYYFCQECADYWEHKND